MRLERVAELCLDFLRQTTNPLTPVSLLYELCVRDPQVGDALTQEALLQFLREHADILVVEGPEHEETVNPAIMAEAGLELGPRAILKIRIPTRSEMADMMGQQIDDMRLRLQDALVQARKNKDHQAAADIEAVLERMARLEASMKDF